VVKFAKKKKRFSPTTSPPPFGTKIKAWKKVGHLVPKMVENILKYLTQLRFIHNWVINRHSMDDSALAVSAGSPPNLFRPKNFIQLIGWWANRVTPKKSWLVPSSFATSSQKSGPVRSDRSSQVRQVCLVKQVQSQAIFEIWELSM